MSAATVVTSARRYYLLKAFAAADVFELGLESVWRAKQEAQPGTSLAADFPSRAALVAAHYSTTEDLTGATVDELVTNAGLSRKQATAVIAAL